MMCMWTSPWIWFAADATVRDFRECFEKSLYGRKSATDDPEFVLSFHRTSDSPPMKGLFVRECAEGSRCSRTLLCVCVWGKYTCFW